MVQDEFLNIRQGMANKLSLKSSWWHGLMDSFIKFISSKWQSWNTENPICLVNNLVSPFLSLDIQSYLSHWTLVTLFLQVKSSGCGPHPTRQWRMTRSFLTWVFANTPSPCCCGCSGWRSCGLTSSSVCWKSTTPSCYCLRRGCDGGGGGDGEGWSGEASPPPSPP